MDTVTWGEQNLCVEKELCMFSDLHICQTMQYSVINGMLEHLLTTTGEVTKVSSCLTPLCTAGVNELQLYLISH